MCPACLAAAAVTAAKVASIGGLTAFGVKKLVDNRFGDRRAKDAPADGDPINPDNGASHEADQSSVA